MSDQPMELREHHHPAPQTDPLPAVTEMQSEQPPKSQTSVSVPIVDPAQHQQQHEQQHHSQPSPQSAPFPDESDDSDMSSEDEDGDNAPSSASGAGKGGSSCHQCKSRRNHSQLTFCTATLDSKSKKCRKKFCGHCLRKFYKENPAAIGDKASWICPSCRKICCCAACRRRKQRDSGVRDEAAELKVKRAKLTRESEGGLAVFDPATGQFSDANALMNGSHLSHSSLTNHDDSGLSNGLMNDSMFASELTLSTNDSDDDDDRPFPALMPVPSSKFNSLLSNHIALLSEESVQNHGESQFAALYKAARAGKVKKRIRQILQRTDVTKQKQVELIAHSLVNIV